MGIGVSAEVCHVRENGRHNGENDPGSPAKRKGRDHGGKVNLRRMRGLDFHPQPCERGNG